MNKELLSSKNRRAMALVPVLLVAMVLLIFSAAFFTISVNQHYTAEIFKRRTEALGLAEAGLDNAIVWLRAQSSPPVGNYTNPWGGIQTLGGGSYDVAIEDLGVVGSSVTVRRYKVTSMGSFGNRTRILTNYVQVDNYARYLWFTDQEVFSGTNVWFWSQDRLNGPTHTNAHYNIMGNPVFESQVQSVDNYVRFYNNGNNINLAQSTNPPYDNPDFQQGLDFGAEQTTMPTQALNLRAGAASGGLSLRGDTIVTFLSNGTMNVTNSRQGWNNRNMALPANGALFVDRGSLTISGTLDGRLTVGTSRDIKIPGNITYADDPEINPNSDDILGIIAEGDVVIDDAAPYDLVIKGCAMAMDTSFMLENWWAVAAKGILTVYGGIIQDERGPVGTFNGQTGQKISGYSKDYRYDPRLLANPPPYMPTTGDYITLSWEEN
ncbi:MAG: hypothetical protein ABH865_07020 [Candidatus Omnitrophota bacterium]|nr:DUF4900 domain-containing protein [Candidatus Omnitrophota bacterium]